jgi:hypothetical protein
MKKLRHHVLSVGPSVRRSIGPSVRRSVCPHDEILRNLLTWKTGYVREEEKEEEFS